MANTDAPMGFKPYQSEGKTYRTRRYAKTAASAVYEGDLLQRVAAGTVETAAASEADTIVGIAARYSAAAESYVDVYDDPEMIFIAQGDTATAVAATHYGQNVDILAGTPSGERSGQELDVSTAAETATLPIKILGLAPDMNGVANALGVNANVLCKLNHTERAAGAGPDAIA